MSAARSRAWVGAAGLLALTACVGAQHHGVRGRYQHETLPPSEGPRPQLISAHLSRFGAELPSLHEGGGPRMVEGGELEHDALILVFAVEIDPATLDEFAFGVLRADGHRVRPVRVFLAPADEGDENRSVTLIGNFGSEGKAPVAVHVIGSLHGEGGESLRGLDAEVSGPEQPDRVVVVERITPDERRCPGAKQVVRTHWSDALSEVGAEDLAGVELWLADGRKLAPSDFDDQAQRSEDPPCAEPFTACLGPADDNVLDLCVDSEVDVVHVRFAAGLFRDPHGHATAAVDIDL